MVDLFLNFKHLPEDKRGSFRAENAIAEVVKKYPILEIKNGEVLFGWVPKCSVDFSKERVHLWTNAPLTDYVVYAAVAFAEVLGIPVIENPQMGREIPISEYARVMEDLPMKLTREQKQSPEPHMIRLYPAHGDRFRLLQLENAIDETNKRLGKQVLVKIPMGNEFSFFVRGEGETNRLATFTADEQLRYIETEYPQTLYAELFERVVATLSEILPAKKRTNR